MEPEECDTNLALSIGGGGGRRIHGCKSEKPPNQLHEEDDDDDDDDEQYSIRKRGSKSRSEDMEAASNFDAKEAGGSRKKLKLSKEQIALLEGSFTEHNTLNSMQKQKLATRLNIQPRQVEVWFQNRRARSKLKQTEGELDCLKKWSEKLSEENRRLKEEIEELRRRRRKEKNRADPPLYMHLTKAAQTSTCPSCGRRAGAAASGSRADDSFSVKSVVGDNWNLYIMG